ncbi:alpha/beta hydrolase [Riemerella anatipestifer]|uniref:Alpha/beta hydrolase n=1 Tax=Riemerella anatipestifer TaxID=34085 RepID=A0AAP3AJU0_RIEAN|nr:alpha/beta hydrolase [Riemerella anatipestifer]MBT0548697.1 alpha/beta hydrolase [Riemerella anatipestifer]MBT0551522.1 alpha/beta hydrolase [Riemerella anatipestifer]MBT0552793.1 alpha/beta hydrolase [Riemerella anatipestifer]MBT0555416.1 alpha/beta hydrolase [Riemerella anatipestifer]MBT0559460.1 alpha/beta hydrolase [Riemerella anatipestifer]
MKLYIISGLGADFKILENIKFPDTVEPIFIPWLIPENNESFEHYVCRMAEKIDFSEPFALLGYSFGGFVVQEINKKIKPAEKVVLLASIKSDSEMPKLGYFFKKMRLIKLLPISFFSEKSVFVYSFIRKFIEADSPRVDKYFRVRDPYYLKWSLDKIVNWEFEKTENIVQIMGDKDIAFPIQNSQPDYIIKNATHLFPATKAKEVSEILRKIF